MRVGDWPTSIPVQYHVPERINLLDRIPIRHPHIQKLGIFVGDKVIGGIICPKKCFPVWMHIQTALPDFGPFRVRGGP